MTDVAQALDETVQRLRDLDARNAQRDALMALFEEAGKPPTAKQLEERLAEREPPSDAQMLAQAVRKLTAAADFQQRTADAERDAADRVREKITKAEERLADAAAAGEEAAAKAVDAQAQAEQAAAVAAAAADEAERRVGGELPPVPVGRNVSVGPTAAVMGS